MTDQTTTEAHRLALSEALGLGTGAPWDAIRDRAAELAAIEPSVDTVANRAAQAISSMGADVRALTQERNRYRNAWHNARSRAADARSDADLAEQQAAAPLSAGEARTRLLQALDASYCQALGHTPEGLLAAYEASRTRTVDQAALVRACASFVRDTYSGEWADDAAATLETDADKIERGEPCSLLRLAAVLPATTNHDTDTSVTPPPALTEEGRLRARVQVLEEDAERDQDLAATGARCLLRGHQGQIESGHAVIEGHRFALSTKLGLGTGAPWDAIHERIAELRRVADETAATATQAATVVDCNSGPGWYEVITPRATTCIAYVHEDGSLYLPEGDLSEEEFAFAAARGMAHRLVRADEQPAAGARQDGADRG
ncbi:hypothetical protein [Streptomyces sp. enrichment culture]|uniref:hypothetical protein n=1 Tax=Streptomyces sp. enrichment culture TaxID=1795815 RepID=UPI003F56A444